MSTTVKIIHYTHREKKDGRYPVKLRIIDNRHHKDYKTGIDLTEEEFNGATQPNPKKKFREIADRISSLREKANDVIKDLHPFTYLRFERHFFGAKKDASDIFPFFEEYINQLEAEDRIKTAMSYRTAMNALKEFHKGKLNLYDISEQLLVQFQKHQVAAGKSLTTVGIYQRSLRSVYNYCVNKGILKKDENYPFGRGKYIIPAGRNVKKALQLEEIGRIARFETIPGTFQDRAKDFWLLSYLLGGINFKDLLLLRKKNVDGDMLRYVREKTRKTTQGNQAYISVYIPKEAKSIIDKWKSKNDDTESFLFPFVQNDDDAKTRHAKIDQFIQNTNKNIGRICKQVGIAKTVTTYYSRHSAATVLKSSGASIAQIQEMLGHSSSAVTQKYLDSFEDDAKKQLTQSLLKF
jgi:integrase